jgi:hypothetical protein
VRVLDLAAGIPAQGQQQGNGQHYSKEMYE